MCSSFFSSLLEASSSFKPGGIHLFMITILAKLLRKKHTRGSTKCVFLLTVSARQSAWRLALVSRLLSLLWRLNVETQCEDSTWRLIVESLLETQCWVSVLRVVCVLSRSLFYFHLLSTFLVLVLVLLLANVKSDKTITRNKQKHALLMAKRFLSHFLMSQLSIFYFIHLTHFVTWWIYDFDDRLFSH